MRVAYVRTGERRDRVFLTRLDGSTATIHPHAYGGVFPHDLAHLAVERALGLRAGFWGLLAAGVDWERVNEASNRGDKGTLGCDPSELVPAEGAVASLAGGDPDPLPDLYRSVGIEPPTDLDLRAGAAMDELDELAGRWAAVEPGDQLVLVWPDDLVAELDRPGRRLLDPGVG